MVASHVPAAHETGGQGFVYLKQLEKLEQGEEYCFLSLQTPDRQTVIGTNPAEC